MADMPQISSILLPGSKRCDVDTGLCVNSFVIQATKYNSFDLTFQPFSQCTDTDANGVLTDLNDNTFLVEMRLKAPSYAAPNGHTITGLEKGLKCVNGQFLVQYMTKYAGQYRITVKLYKGMSPQNLPLYEDLVDADEKNEAGAFERAATLVLPGEGVTYLVDSILSFRPVCNANNEGSLECAYCQKPAINGGCAGNDYIPRVYQQSRMIITAADKYSNTVNDDCAGGLGVTAQILALKQPSIAPSDCGQNTAGYSYCRNIEVTQRPTDYGLQPCEDGSVCGKRCGGCLSNPSDAACQTCPYTCGNGASCPAVCQAPYYFVKFRPLINGYYTLTVNIAGVSLGPVVVPVLASAVSPADTFAFGQGLFGAVASQGVSFEIQPKDQYGNHHTKGVHVFQVRGVLRRPRRACLFVNSPKLYASSISYLPTRARRASSLPSPREIHLPFLVATPTTNSPSWLGRW